MSNSNHIRLATRGSALAQWQADRIAALLRASRPDVTVEKIIISTQPDRVQDKPLHAMGDKGLFVKEVEQAVLDGRADAAVHSLKDVPIEDTAAGLMLAAFPEREDAADVLLAKAGQTLGQLLEGNVVATGAPRRQAQLLALRPDLEVCDVRGNVETRIRKLHDGEYDAIIMAAAGLRRLGLDEHISQIFGFDDFVPAPGQAIVVVQAPEESPFAELWAAIDSPTVRLQAETEREFSRLIGADCHCAAGGHLDLAGETATFHGIVCATDGSRCVRYKREAPAGATAADIAKHAADDLLAQGAQDLMK
jgi:hydroxymethylbilane synthase